jgi:hypothetical protein
METVPGQIFPINMLYGEVSKIENQLKRLDNFVQSDVILTAHGAMN